jgi:hypothetical protein
MSFRYNPVTGSLDMVTDIPADTTHLLKSGGTMTGELDIRYDYSLFKVFNTAYYQYAGAGFYLINDVASMGDQAGITFYMGINDAASTQGFFAVDKTNTTGGGTGHLWLMDFATNVTTFYQNVTLPKLNISNPTVPSTATSTGAKGDIAYDTNYLYVCVATNTWKRVALSTW